MVDQGEVEVEVRGIRAIKLAVRRKRTHVAVLFSSTASVLALDNLAWYWAVPIAMTLFVATTIVLQTAIQAELDKDS